MYFLLGYEFTLVTCRNRIICKFNNLAKDAKKNNRIVCKHVQTMFWVAHTFCYDKSRGVTGIREMVPRITSCGRDVWSQKIALRREWCLHFFLQVQTWNPPEGENHVDGQAWAGLSLWRCFLELTNFLWLHAAMVAIEATDWLDSNCMLQTFVLLSPRHPWSHDFQCTWAYKCSVWHTHAGKMSLSCLYKFKQDIRKTVKVTQLHIWFLQNCELLIFWSRSNSMNVWRPCWRRLLLQAWAIKDLNATLTGHRPPSLWKMFTAGTRRVPQNLSQTSNCNFCFKVLASCNESRCAARCAQWV